MIKIGITGGIGSGKSTVCKIFAILGIPIFDADSVAKALYHEDELKEKIISLFGAEIYPEGNFDRKKLAEIVFASDEKLLLLNQMIHPMVQAKFVSWCDAQDSPYIIKEAALLIESGSYKHLDKMIMVSCPLNQRIARVMQRDQMSKDMVLARLNKQMNEEDKKKFCQYEIVNDGNELLIPQVTKLHQLFIGMSTKSEAAY